MFKYVIFRFGPDGILLAELALDGGKGGREGVVDSGCRLSALEIIVFGTVSNSKLVRY